jgi:hypothetical protein
VCKDSAQDNRWVCLAACVMGSRCSGDGIMRVPAVLVHRRVSRIMSCRVGMSGGGSMRRGISSGCAHTKGCKLQQLWCGWEAAAAAALLASTVEQCEHAAGVWVMYA